MDLQVASGPAGKEGKLAAATCNGWNKRTGYRILAVYDKKSGRLRPHGYEILRGLHKDGDFWNAWMEKYEVWWVGDRDASEAIK